MAKIPKRPRDPNQLAKMIVDIATGEEENERPEKCPKHEGQRKGGLSGGKARAKALTPEQRREIAKKAAKERWKDKD